MISSGLTCKCRSKIFVRRCNKNRSNFWKLCMNWGIRMDTTCWYIESTDQTSEQTSDVWTEIAMSMKHLIEVNTSKAFTVMFLEIRRMMSWRQIWNDHQYIESLLSHGTISITMKNTCPLTCLTYWNNKFYKAASSVNVDVLMTIRYLEVLSYIIKYRVYSQLLTES